ARLAIWLRGRAKPTIDAACWTPSRIGTFQSTLAFDSAFRTLHSTLALPPFPDPPVVQDRDHAALLQHLDARRVTVRLAIEHVRYARVDDELGAHHAGRRTDEHDLVARVPRRLDERVHLGVNAPAAPRHRRVALVRQAARVAVVPDREHVLEHLVRDDRAYLEARARGALRQLLGHPHIHLVQRD